MRGLYPRKQTPHPSQSRCARLIHLLPQGEKGRARLSIEARLGLQLCGREPDMTTTEATADASASANRTGGYLAVLQLVFTLGWTTYVIYLPKLAAQAGIAPGTVILILMLDQAIFTITDTAM